MTSTPFCAIVPAGGSGQRMGRDTPKQYLPLAGATVLEWALAPLLAAGGLQRLVVAVPAGDTRFAELPCAADERVRTVTGGATRADSVAAGLAALTDLDDTLPVAVHDAARPCLTVDDLERLLAVAHEPAGALLAVAVSDTLKRASAVGEVEETVDRNALWQALTPQAFPLATLRRALVARDPADAGITDEASAVERLGLAPRLIAGDPANIKVTQPGHLVLAEAILAARGGPS
ncbi:MAG: 2-C-methyl-D-erythritol 4-phosphate cytidylyltransferase [Halofilum sp. (in: g-proteobacteria)]